MCLLFTSVPAKKMRPSGPIPAPFQTILVSNEGEMSVIDFSRIAGGKPFDIDEPWFGELLSAIGQPKTGKVAGH